MRYMFENATSFNSDLSKWNVGNVKEMSSMFSNATSFNSDLSKWNVGNVKDMSYMFSNATSFMSDLSQWDVGNVWDMRGMFARATSFASDLSQWNMASVEITNDMFEGATKFGPPLKQRDDRGWTQDSLADHMAFANKSEARKTYRARRRWRRMRELFLGLHLSVVAKWYDQKRFDPTVPGTLERLKMEFEEEVLKKFEKVAHSRRTQGTQEFLTRARRLCDILIQTRLDV